MEEKVFVVIAERAAMPDDLVQNLRSLLGADAVDRGWNEAWICVTESKKEEILLWLQETYPEKKWCIFC